MSDYIFTSANAERLSDLNLAGYKTTNSLYCHANDLDVKLEGASTVTIFGNKDLVAIEGPAVHEKEGLSKEAMIPRALDWQIGGSAAAFADALVANGVLPRWLQGQTVIDLQALAPFNLFSEEQTEALLNAITIVRDRTGKAFTPLGTLFFLHQLRS